MEALRHPQSSNLPLAAHQDKEPGLIRYRNRIIEIRAFTRPRERCRTAIARLTQGANDIGGKIRRIANDQHALAPPR